MASLASYTLGGLALVLALDFAAPSVATGIARALSDNKQASFAARFSPASGATGTLQVIDRTGKTSRLPLTVTSVPKSAVKSDATQRPATNAPKADAPRNPVREVEPATPAKAPVGCDPAFSSLSRATTDRFIGRCFV